MAGLGRAPAAADPDRYQHRHAHCDVLVIGAGPAGLAAALAASESGARVMLADEQAEMGGALLHDVTSDDRRQGGLGLARRGDRRAGQAEQRHAAAADHCVRLLQSQPRRAGAANRPTIWARPHADLPRERLWQVRAREVVLATGAHERPLVFAGNDRPGIMLADSLRAYVNRYGVAPGRRAVIATCGASAYMAAADLKAAGLEVTLVDVRPESECGEDMDALRSVGCTVLAGHTVLGSHGDKRVAGLLVAPTDAGPSAAPRLLDCDCVGLSGGWTPAVHLFSQSRGRLAFDARTRCVRAGRLRAGRALGGRLQGHLSARDLPGGRLGRRRCRGGRHGRAQLRGERDA